ncbi:MAG: hypothetical protein K1X74_17090 [Pirellulales bacterium]|nr:hypothetical protein [Pirellulales bacterium]
MAQLPPLAGPNSGEELRAKLLKRGDLMLSDTPFRQALFSISEQWGVNIVVAADVEGTVSGSFRQAPLHEILDSILLANGYGYRPVGASFVVMKLESLGESNPLFETATIPLKVVKPEDILTSAQALASPQGKVQAVASAKCLIVVDFPEQVRRISELAQKLDDAAALTELGGADGPLDVLHYTPQYVKAPPLEPSIKSMLSATGKVAVIETENRLVVIDTPANLVLVRKALEQLDTPRAQVRITALIYDVALEDLERCGINWNHAFKGRHNAAGEAQLAWSIDSLTQVPVASGNPAGAMTLMSLSRAFDITAAVDFLATSANSQLLADPMIFVSDYEEAHIEIVTEIPYQQLTQTQQGGNIGSTAFREAGVMLDVTPQIAADGTVLLKVKPEFSRLTGFTEGQTPQPIIDRRTAETVVRVLNGQTFVIGGLRQRSDINKFSGLPYLKDIKFLGIGKLFQSRNISTKEGELIVFLTPEIVGPCQMPRQREMAAGQHGQAVLDMNPPAGQTPFPSPLNDPNCPPVERFYEEVPPPEAVPAGPVGEPTPAFGPETQIRRQEGAAAVAASRRPQATQPLANPPGVIDLRPRSERPSARPQPPRPNLESPPPGMASRQSPLAAGNAPAVPTTPASPPPPAAGGLFAPPRGQQGTAAPGVMQAQRPNGVQRR